MFLHRCWSLLPRLVFALFFACSLTGPAYAISLTDRCELFLKSTLPIFEQTSLSPSQFAFELNSFLRLWKTNRQTKLIEKATRLELARVERDFYESQPGRRKVLRMSFDLKNGIRAILELPTAKNWNALMLRPSLHSHLGKHDQLYYDNIQKIFILIPSRIGFDREGLESLVEGLRRRAESYANSREVVPEGRSPIQGFSLARWKNEDPIDVVGDHQQVILRPLLWEWTHLYAFLASASLLLEDLEELPVRAHD